jgi:hypothetical protein
MSLVVVSRFGMPSLCLDAVTPKADILEKEQPIALQLQADIGFMGAWVWVGSTLSLRGLGAFMTLTKAAEGAEIVQLAREPAQHVGKLYEYSTDILIKPWDHRD